MGTVQFKLDGVTVLVRLAVSIAGLMGHVADRTIVGGEELPLHPFSN